MGLNGYGEYIYFSNMYIFYCMRVGGDNSNNYTPGGVWKSRRH